MTDFEPVTADRDDPGESLYVSVAGNGAWYLPRKTYSAFFEGEDHVAVAADPATGRVAIRPVDDPDDAQPWPSSDSDDVTIYALAEGERGGVRFTSSAALTEAGVRPESSVRAEPRWEDSVGAIVVDLREAIGEDD